MRKPGTIDFTYSHFHNPYQNSVKLTDRKVTYVQHGTLANQFSVTIGVKRNHMLFFGEQLSFSVLKGNSIFSN